MSYDTANYRDVETKAPSMHFLREPLDCENLGITVLEPKAGWTGKEHDHAEQDHEEVYLLLDGAATIEVDGEEVTMEPGDAVRVDPGSSRQIRVEEDARMVVAGAP